ncbi:MAG: sulfatase-like hydrolase/transferase [Cyclobacteriaceae bacterium]
MINSQPKNLMRNYSTYFTLMLVFFSFAALAQKAKPNIILIISDDQGYHDLGSYGNDEIITPHLDQLATEGVILTNFYVTGSGCTPSRSGLLTGRYPQRNGTFELFRNNMVNYGHHYTEYEYSVSPERILGTDLREIFISEALKEADYTNGYFGKWDLGQLRRYLPLQQGFDEFYGFANTGIDYFTHERYGSPSMLDGNTPTIKDKGAYTTDLFEREALKFIDQNADSPFFLYLAYNAPHNASNLDPEVRGTVQATEKYLQMYSKGDTPRANRQRGYKAAVTHMDQSIGNILAMVKKKGLDDNTLVIFLSDNGGSGLADNYPLRGGKAQFFEGGIRVPCMVKWPGIIEPGQTNHDFLSSLEIFPTIIAAAGLNLPENVVYDGFDMLPALQGKPYAKRTHMFWEFRGDVAARMDHWKWVRSARGNGLFDLSQDIEEQRDLSLEYPEILEKITGEFVNWQGAMANAEPRGPFKDF